MDETKEIPDLIVIERVAPDSLKNGCITYCIGGWSTYTRYIRVYPTSLKTNLK